MLWVSTELLGWRISYKGTKLILKRQFCLNKLHTTIKYRVVFQIMTILSFVDLDFPTHLLISDSRWLQSAINDIFNVAGLAFLFFIHQLHYSHQKKKKWIEEGGMMLVERVQLMTSLFWFWDYAIWFWLWDYVIWFWPNFDRVEACFPSLPDVCVISSGTRLW